VYGRTIPELEKKYREMMLLIDKGIILNKESMTMAELYDEWYRLKKAGKIKANTIKSYNTISKHIKDKLGDMSVKDVTMYSIESTINEFESKGNERTALAVLRAVNSMMEYAIRNNIVAVNPCREISVKYSPKGKRALTEQEKANISNNLYKIMERQRMYLLILRYTGMRKGEALSLSKQDINKENMTIRINKTLIDCKGVPYIQETAKSKAGERHVPIFVPLAKPLFDYIEKLDGDYLFTTSNGNFISLSQTSAWSGQIKNNIGLGEDFTTHMLRHNFISECYSAGVDVKVLQQWAGHKDISTTLNIYTHLANEKINKADKMNDFYGSQTEVKKQSVEIKQPLKLVK
jgi:integrase